MHVLRDAPHTPLPLKVLLTHQRTTGGRRGDGRWRSGAGRCSCRCCCCKLLLQYCAGCCCDERFPLLLSLRPVGGCGCGPSGATPR